MRRARAPDDAPASDALREAVPPDVMALILRHACGSLDGAPRVAARLRVACAAWPCAVALAGKRGYRDVLKAYAPEKEWEDVIGLLQRVRRRLEEACDMERSVVAAEYLVYARVVRYAQPRCATRYTANAFDGRDLGWRLRSALKSNNRGRPPDGAVRTIAMSSIEDDNCLELLAADARVVFAAHRTTIIPKRSSLRAAADGWRTVGCDLNIQRLVCDEPEQRYTSL